MLLPYMGTHCATSNRPYQASRSFDSLGERKIDKGVRSPSNSVAMNSNFPLPPRHRSRFHVRKMFAKLWWPTCVHHSRIITMSPQTWMLVSHEDRTVCTFFSLMLNAGVNLIHRRSAAHRTQERSPADQSVYKCVHVTPYNFPWHSRCRSQPPVCPQRGHSRRSQPQGWLSFTTKSLYSPRMFLVCTGTWRLPASFLLVSAPNTVPFRPYVQSRVTLASELNWIEHRHASRREMNILGFDSKFHLKGRIYSIALQTFMFNFIL